jgi:hypothetical protein
MFGRSCKTVKSPAVVEDQQFVFKAEFPLSMNLTPDFGEQTQEDFLIKLPGAVSVGISEGGVTGSSNAQMFQFTFTAFKTPGDLPKRMGPAKLTEEHGYKLSPAGEA